MLASDLFVSPIPKELHRKLAPFGHTLRVIAAHRLVPVASEASEHNPRIPNRLRMTHCYTVLPRKIVPAEGKNRLDLALLVMDANALPNFSG